jgi:hypothetical protein
VSLESRPRLSRVQHEAELRARAANASVPPTARASRATGQTAAAVLQGGGSGSKPNADTGRAKPQAGALPSHHHLRGVADVEATPVQTGQPV